MNTTYRVHLTHGFLWIQGQHPETLSPSLSFFLDGSCLGDTLSEWFRSCAAKLHFQCIKGNARKNRIPILWKSLHTLLSQWSIKTNPWCLQIKSRGNHTGKHALLSSKQAVFLSKPQPLTNLYLDFVEGQHKGKYHCLQLCVAVFSPPVTWPRHPWIEPQIPPGLHH